MGTGNQVLSLSECRGQCPVYHGCRRNKEVRLLGSCSFSIFLRETVVRATLPVWPLVAYPSGLVKEIDALEHSRRPAVGRTFFWRKIRTFLRCFTLFSPFFLIFAFSLLNPATSCHRQPHAVILSHPTLYSDCPILRYGPYSDSVTTNKQILNLSRSFRRPTSRMLFQSDMMSEVVWTGFLPLSQRRSLHISFSTRPTSEYSSILIFFTHLYFNKLPVTVTVTVTFSFSFVWNQHGLCCCCCCCILRCILWVCCVASPVSCAILRHVSSMAFFLCVACLLACFCTVSVFCSCLRSAYVGSQCHFCTISSTFSSHRFYCLSK